MNYIVRIFQDVDGEPSSKRWVLFIFVALFVALTMLIYFRAVDPSAIDFLKSALSQDAELIKWMGGFVVAERAQWFAGKRGP